MVEAARDFGEAEPDESDQQAAPNDDGNAVVADQRLDPTLQAEDAGADGEVDCEGYECPTAYGAKQTGVGVAGQGRHANPYPGRSSPHWVYRKRPVIHDTERVHAGCEAGLCRDCAPSFR